MKLRKERSISIVYDAVSISKDIEVIGGPLTLNFYVKSGSYAPNRFLTPLVLKPIVYVADPNKVIPEGDKSDELVKCNWYEDGKQIISGDEYKINKDNSLTVLKNSTKDLTISFSATWFDPRKKQEITIEESVDLVCVQLAGDTSNPILKLDKPLNWIHNPLKNDRIYTIKAYVSKDKIYEGAVEWYYSTKGKEPKLIDNTLLAYEGGQYTNELKLNSAYLENCLITAKNLSNEKLKEYYWFFNEDGNPLTYAMPEKTIIEGKDVFSLPESPITSKLDYRINGLTIEQLVKNGDFKDGINFWNQILNGDSFEVEPVKDKGVSMKIKKIGDVGFVQPLNTSIDENDIIYVRYEYNRDKAKDKAFGLISIESKYYKTNTSNLRKSLFSKKIVVSKDLVAKKDLIYITVKDNGLEIGETVYIKDIMLINLTKIFGKDNEPSKEWCDVNLPDYFEGVKSVQAPMRVKSVGENLVDYLDPRNHTPQTKITYGDVITSSIELFICLKYRVYKGVSYWLSGTFVGSSPSTALKASIQSEGGEYKPSKTLWIDAGRVTDGQKFSVREPITPAEDGYHFLIINAALGAKDVVISRTGSTNFTPYTESNLYLNNQLELKSVGEVKDYIENGKLYKCISDEGEILKETEIINLSTQGNLTTHPNGTIFIEPATLVEKQYNDGLQVDLPVKTLESIKVGTEYLDTSKAVVKDNLITHPDIENGDNVTIEYIYDENPIRNTNSIAYLVLEDILDEFWLDNVYTYKITDGEWELVKVTDIENYEEWLKTEKTSPYTLAPDGVIFGKYKADTKFLRQFPSSLYVDIIIPNRLKDGSGKVKARALVGTADGIIENPERYFKITWLRRDIKAGSKDEVIGLGEEILLDIDEKSSISIDVEDLGILKALTDENGKYLTDENNTILVGR